MKPDVHFEFYRRGLLKCFFFQIVGSTHNVKGVADGGVSDVMTPELFITVGVDQPPELSRFSFFFHECL